MGDYVLEQEADALRGRERLARIQDYQDPPTTRFLEALGVAEGWNCLDVGAGAGSIAAWLAKRVAPTGTVLATDLETRLLCTQVKRSGRRHLVSSAQS